MHLKSTQTYRLQTAVNKTNRIKKQAHARTYTHTQTYILPILITVNNISATHYAYTAMTRSSKVSFVIPLTHHSSHTIATDKFSTRPPNLHWKRQDFLTQWSAKYRYPRIIPTAAWSKILFIVTDSPSTVKHTANRPCKCSSSIHFTT